MKQHYQAPAALFKPLRLSESIAAVCWAYAANNKDNTYQYVDPAYPTQKMTFSITGLEGNKGSNCDNGRMTNIKYTLPFSGPPDGEDYKVYMNLQTLFASIGNSGEPWNGGTIVPFDNQGGPFSPYPTP